MVLALCGAALRRFLLELGELPEKPLTAGIPVSVRPADDDTTGNAITFIISTLGTDIDDPRERLEAIKASTRRAKEHLQELPRQALMQYTIMLMAPYMLSLLTGVGGRTRPMFNVTISNVPGPAMPLYFRGARLQATYPVSLVTHGQALNITCHGYAGTLAFGFTAAATRCRTCSAWRPTAPKPWSNSKRPSHGPPSRRRRGGRRRRAGPRAARGLLRRAAQPVDLARRYARSAIAPRGPHPGHDGGDLGVAQRVAEGRHPPGPGVALRARREASEQHRADRVRRVGET